MYIYIYLFVQILLGGGTNIGPDSFHPSPSPASAKFSGLAANKLRKNTLDDFYDIHEQNNFFFNEPLEIQINILYWVMDGTNIGAYLPPSPIPILIPGLSKSLLPGGNQILKNHWFEDFL